jgi:hypothetical protein
VSISNTNRQLHALDGEFGKSKIEVMAKRLSLINPDLKINCIDDFLKPENFQEYLPQGAAILDAMDDVASKLSLASWSHQKKVAYVMSGGAGGKLDPSKIEVVDLARATHDSMLAKIRASLRQQYGFEKDPKRKMNLRVIYSSEPRIGVASGGLEKLLGVPTSGLMGAASKLLPKIGGNITGSLSDLGSIGADVGKLTAGLTNATKALSLSKAAHGVASNIFGEARAESVANAVDSTAKLAVAVNGPITMVTAFGDKITSAPNVNQLKSAVQAGAQNIIGSGQRV